MELIPLIVFGAVVGACVGFAFLIDHLCRRSKQPQAADLSLSSRSERARGLTYKAQAAGPSQGSITAAELLQTLEQLRKDHAQWQEIWAAINPDNDPVVQQLLVRLRGPHMFAPHVGINVIATGCRHAMAKDPRASRLAALEAATMSEVITRPD